MKKNKFLKIISSVFAVFAICGLACLNLFIDEKKNLQTKADYVSLIYESTGSTTLGQESNVDFDFEYDFYVYRVVGSNIYYQVNFNVDFSEFRSRTVVNGQTIYLVDDDNQHFGYSISSRNNYVTLPSSLTVYFEVEFSYDVNTFNSPTGFNSGTLDFNYSAKFDNETITTLDTNFDNETFHLNPYVGIAPAYTTVISYFFDRDYDTLEFTNITDPANEITSSYNEGFTDGYNNGYNQGYNAGKVVGDQNSYNQGYNAGVLSMQDAVSNSYSQGYTDGYESADSEDETVTTIFSGILTVGMLPVNFFLSIFNFEILGINLSAFIKAIFTVALTLIVLRVVLLKDRG